MSVYIPGMEMPVCHFKTSESYNVHGFWMVYPDGKSKLHIMVGSDHWVCEAIPVPDHGRLIEAEAAKEILKPIDSLCCYEPEWTWGELYESNCVAIDKLPTIIPADKGVE